MFVFFVRGSVGLQLKSNLINIIFSERELAFTFAICHRSPARLSSVCLSVVCNVGAPYSDD